VIFKQIDRYFWIFIAIGVLFGFVFPGWLHQFDGYVMYIIMAIMTFLFLKVNIVEVVLDIKKPFSLLYISIIHLLAIPLVLYLTLFRFLNPDLAQAFLLLSALPAGVSSAAFTGIMKGRTSLGLTIVILTNLLAPFTIPFLFWLFFQKTLPLDYLGLMTHLSLIILIPFGIAKFIELIINKTLLEKIQDYYDVIILALLSIMVMISIAYSADYIKTHFLMLLKTLGLLYILFALLQLLSYFSVYWKTRNEKLTVSNSKMILNNVLGVVLALAFFTPQITTVVVLSLIPWGTMIILVNWYKRYLP